METFLYANTFGMVLSVQQGVASAQQPITWYDSELIMEGLHLWPTELVVGDQTVLVRVFVVKDILHCSFVMRLPALVVNRHVMVLGLQSRWSAVSNMCHTAYPNLIAEKTIYSLYGNVHVLVPKKLCLNKSNLAEVVNVHVVVVVVVVVFVVVVFCCCLL